jgi:hypothetical protein
MMERVLNFLALALHKEKGTKQKEMGVILTFFIHVNYYVGIVSSYLQLKTPSLMHASIQCKCTNPPYFENPLSSPNANIEAHSNPQRYAGNTANVVIIQTYETPVMVRCTPST